MTAARHVISLVRSRTVTVWLVGTFILYYLTMAVWTGEALSAYTSQLSSSPLFQAFYVLFLVNVTFRVIDVARNRSFRRTTVLLRMPLLIGLLLCLISFFLSLNFRQVLWSPPLGAGDTIDLPWEQQRYRIASVEPALQKHALRTDDASIFDYEPGITITDEKGAAYAIGAFPPRKVGTTFFHVLTFGIGPGVIIESGHRVVWKGNVALRLTPFGVVDEFELPDLPYKFSLGIIPNRAISKGRETAREYDLGRPRFRVQILKGHAVVGEGETEEGISFDKDARLLFSSPADWVLIEAVNDPFLLWFVWGLGLLVTGSPLYLASFLIR